jgi:mycoredoxin
VVVGADVASGAPAVALVEALALATLGGVVSPLAFPRSLSAAEAQRRSAQDGRPVVFWRPGCSYCLRLRFRLGRRSREAYWVNIWADRAAAARVRDVTGGDETVPTCVVGDQAVVNPDPAWVRAACLASVRT